MKAKVHTGLLGPSQCRSPSFLPGQEQPAEPVTPKSPDPVSSGFRLNTEGLFSLDRETADNMIQKQPWEGKGNQPPTIFQYKKKGASYEKSKTLKNKLKKVALQLDCNCIMEQQVGKSRMPQINQGNKAAGGY